MSFLYSLDVRSERAGLYCVSLLAAVRSLILKNCVFRLCRAAPSIDLVLMTHGDLAHSGLYAYAYSHWGLTAPAYTSLPVQAMARVAATEDVEGVRDEEAVDPEISEPEQDGIANGVMSPHEASEPQEKERAPTPQNSTSSSNPKKRKYVATVQEVHEAFDSVNVLRYSQPCHLQGIVFDSFLSL